MKDGNSTVLYTRETRKYAHTCDESDTVASRRLRRSPASLAIT